MTNVADQYVGVAVYDPSGEKIGRIRQLYLHGVTRQPRWITVGTGLFGFTKSLVPLAGAHLPDRDSVRVAVTKEAVQSAPRIDNGDQIAGEDEVRLMRHYGLPQQSPHTSHPVEQPTSGKHPVTMAAAAVAGIGGTAANTSAAAHTAPPTGER
jgi:PRC-barrel domain